MAILEVEYKGKLVKLEGDPQSVMYAMEAFGIANQIENQSLKKALRGDNGPKIPSVQIDVTKGQFS